MCLPKGENEAQGSKQLVLGHPASSCLSGIFWLSEGLPGVTEGGKERVPRSREKNLANNADLVGEGMIRVR